jgi:hypothetical protein
MLVIQELSALQIQCLLGIEERTLLPRNIDRYDISKNGEERE